MSENVKDFDGWKLLHNYLKKYGCEMEWHSWCVIREEHRAVKSEVTQLRAKIEKLEASNDLMVQDLERMEKELRPNSKGKGE